jgi:hypothetical protein
MLGPLTFCFALSAHFDPCHSRTLRAGITRERDIAVGPGREKRRGERSREVFTALELKGEGIDAPASTAVKVNNDVNPSTAFDTAGSQPFCMRPAGISGKVRFRSRESSGALCIGLQRGLAAGKTRSEPRKSSIAVVSNSFRIAHAPHGPSSP